MKRKGFTLVELLAVIAILAILTVIAVPNVLKMYNNSFSYTEDFSKAQELADGILNQKISDSFDGLIKQINVHLPKIEKLNYLKEHNLDDYIYSCLGPGKFNEYRHNECEKKYGIKLFKHNCGHSCRKCAHHNLLRYYENNENFPQEFIDKCWKIMSNNSYASRNMLFGDNISLEQKIKNLYVE